MDIKDIEKIADLLQRSTLTRVEVEGPEWTLEVERHHPAMYALAEPTDQAAAIEIPMVVHAMEEPIAASPDLTFVEAPVVGVFHEPSQAVAVGQVVRAGDLLGSIEALALRNDIRSPVEGEVTAIQVEDGQPVEYGQTLFTIARVEA